MAQGQLAGDGHAFEEEKERLLCSFLTKKSSVFWRGHEVCLVVRSRIIEFDDEAGDSNGHFLHVHRQESMLHLPPYMTWHYVKSGSGAYEDVVTSDGMFDVRYFPTHGAMESYFEEMMALPPHPHASHPLRDDCCRPVSYSLVRYAHVATPAKIRETLDGEAFVRHYLTDDYRAFLVGSGSVAATDFKTGCILCGGGAIADVFTKKEPVTPGQPLRRFYVDVYQGDALAASSASEEAGRLRVCVGYDALARFLDKVVRSPAPDGVLFSARGRRLVVGGLGLY